MARKRRFSTNAYDQINVTPLIDTLFFLLIIFMITAPLLEYTTDVTPPSMKSEEMKPDENTRVVSLNKTGQIFLDKKQVSEADLVNQLRAMKSAQPNKKFSIMLRADGAQKYEKVIDVMKAIKKADFKDIALVTEAEQ
jgi:biopolymer transport protein TolR